MLKRLTTTLLLAAVPFGSLIAQEKLVETVEVSVVEVPVTVVTRDGEPVRGLDKESFELFADGRKVPIEYFEVVDLEVMANAPAGTPVPPAARGHFLLLFDITNSEPGNLARARDAAKQFVNEELRPQDLAAVGTFTVEQGIRLLTNLTSNRALLSDAIETLGHPNYFRLGDPLFLSASNPADLGRSGTTQGNRAAVEAAIVEQAEEFNRMTRTGNDDQRRTRLRQQFANFGAFARVLDSIKGRKQILWLSEGFDPRLIQGNAPIGGSEGLAQMDAATSGEVWKIDNEERFGNVSSSNDIQEMGELFRRSDVVLHAIDIRGLRSGVDAQEGYSASKSSVESLFLVAEPTGGEVFKNANELEQNFEKLIESQEVVYILGFKPSGDAKPGEFRKLDVKVRNVPRGTRVDHRAGFYASGGEKSGLERSLSIAEIMLNDIDRDQVDLDVVAAPFPVPGQIPQVPVVIEIPGEKLLRSAAGDQVIGELYVYAFDESDRVADFLHQQITLDLNQVRGQLSSTGLRFYGTLNLDPGTYAVKTLMSIQGTNATGFQRTNLIVPDFGGTVVLPPFLVSQSDEWIMLRGRSREGAPYPFAVGEQGFVPGVEPTLATDQEYQVALFTWNVPAEELGLSATLTTDGGENKVADVQLLGRTPVDESGAMKLLFKFSPKELPQGHHYLNFLVKPKGGSMKVVSMPFNVL